VTSNTLELDSHGFEDDTVVQLRTAGGGSLPSPLVEGVNYYAIGTDTWRFQLASSAGGAAIDLTDAGTTFVVLAPLPIDDAISKASRLIDDMLPAHVVPLSDPVPDVIRITCAELAASDMLSLTGGESPSLTAVYDAARRRLDRWSRNIPIRGDNAPPTAQRSVSSPSSSSASSAAVSPWTRYGGIA
jgi:hypothetical protein